MPLSTKRVFYLKYLSHSIFADLLGARPDAFAPGPPALQRACEIQVATASMGMPIIEIAPEVIAVHQRDLHQVQVPGGAGKADFDAMVRLVDKIDTGWRN